MTHLNGRLPESPEVYPDDICEGRGAQGELPGANLMSQSDV